MSNKGRADRDGVASTAVNATRNGLAHPGIRRDEGQAGGPERVMGLQRARMLAAMVQASVERGAGNVTVADIVGRAGVSRRTFYEVFRDRDDCFLAAFDEGIVRASRHVLDAYDPDANWIDRVRVALIALLRFLDDEPSTGQLLLVGSLGAGPRALERRQGVLRELIAVTDQGRAQAKTGQDAPPLTAEGIVGGVISVLHARLLEEDPAPLLELTGPLMGMIVLPYLGASAARRELARPAPKPAPRGEGTGSGANPLMQLEMRLTYRTVRVLMAIAANPGSSNRIVADASGVSDQGQMSKLLTRLAQLELIVNTGAGPARGEPNAWTLTEKGWQVQGAIAEQTTHG
jgi:AcrR family transcriptional regulator